MGSLLVEKINSRENEVGFYVITNTFIEYHYEELLRETLWGIKAFSDLVLHGRYTHWWLNELNKQW